MDGREGMAHMGSASYNYLGNRGFGGGSGSGSVHTAASGVPTPPGFKPSTPNFSYHQTSVGVSHVGSSSFQVGNPSSIPHGISIVGAPSASPGGEPGKKKRGRPRKYGPDGTNMALGLSPMSSTPSPGSITPGTGEPKRARGRPRGSGRKQQLAAVGEWMNNSAGLAFTPHVIQIGTGEDVAAKILSFAQQRPRALCILAASGSVSAVTLRQPSGGTVTYEGRFQILCLSGNYLVAESGGPRNRTGGLSISVSSPDGHVIGGAIGGRLQAANLVQVVVCSFVYGGSKAKGTTETSPNDDKDSEVHPGEKLSGAISGAPSHEPTPNSASGGWSSSLRPDLKLPETEIDLTRG